MDSTSPRVLISGGGASGLFLALLLSHQLPRARITVLELQTKYASSPKAYAYLPVLFTSFKSAGIWDSLVTAAAQQVDTGIYFRLTADPQKRVVFEMPKPKGAMGPILLPQGAWLGVVRDALEKCGNVDVRMGRRVVGYAGGVGEEEVRARVMNADGVEETLVTDYLIGADGSHSTVRKAAGIAFSGATLPQQLVSCDVRYPFQDYGWSGGNFLLDDKFYGHIGSIDNRGLWRVSFAIDDSAATYEEIQQLLPEWFDAMFPGPRPLHYAVDQFAGYRAQQLCADTFVKGRVILIGDAAHLTNPYIGLGLATGLLDAAALAPVLTAILTGAASHRLLDSWDAARRSVFRGFVDPMSRAAFASVQDPDLDTFPERHPLLKRALQAVKDGKGPGLPPVVTDVTKLEGWSRAGQESARQWKVGG